jgi:membrane protein HdeD
MNTVVVRRRRSGWDVVLGVLLILGGFFVLGDVVLATAVSVLFLAWAAVICGVIALVAALSRIGHGHFWSTALSGALLLVLGLMFLRNLGAAALTLTLLAGALFLGSGITRIVAGFQATGYRWVLILGGVVSTVLGLLVLFNAFTFTFTLLGVLLGIQILVDGVSLLIGGRVHLDSVGDDDGASSGFVRKLTGRRR